jgi:hypothetical protein
MRPPSSAPALALLAVLLAAPSAARAAAGLHLTSDLLEGRPVTGTVAHLAVPRLDPGTLAVPEPFWAMDRGGGGHLRADPAICLVLGIIPGFGIGHYLAGSDRWVIWLVVDIAIAVVFWGPLWYWPGHPGYFPLFNVLVLVERVFEGILAYQAAGGRPIRLSDALQAVPLPPSPGLAAIPVGRTPGVSW